MKRFGYTLSVSALRFPFTRNSRQPRPNNRRQADWLSGQAPRKDGLPVRVLPLDDQLQRKPAWTAVVNALSGR